MRAIFVVRYYHMIKFSSSDSLGFGLRAMLGFMRRLGIDFGTKKIGLALTDESGKMAFPHSVVPNDGSFIDTIEALIADKNVEEIVIGHSLNLDGKANPVQKHIDVFIGDMTLRQPIPIHLEPEQLSTQQAAKTTGRNDQTDASAAAIILDTYLLKQN